jgi:hypothetical protein
LNTSKYQRRGVPSTQSLLPLLVGLNVTRLGVVLFVLLALAGRLSGPFPHISG